MAMITRISTGMVVQAISSTVLWLVRLATGLRLWLNRNDVYSSRPATKMVISVMITITRLCNEMICAFTGLNAGCMSISQGTGCCANAG